MPNVMLQRYLLAAATPSTPIVASGNASLPVTSAIVPLGASWTVRLRSINGGIVPQDNSGEIVIANILLAWTFLDANGNNLFSVLPASSIIAVNPFFATSHLANVTYTWHGDINQVISSFDQGMSGFARSVQALCVPTVVNIDAANPHSIIAQISAILEFDDPGSA